MEARSVAARSRAKTPLRNRSPARYADYAVIGADMDCAIVNQEIIGDRREPPAGIVFLVRDRFVGRVAAGEDDRRTNRFAKQMMYRRIRQHHANRSIAGRNWMRQLRADSAREHGSTTHDGTN